MMRALACTLSALALLAGGCQQPTMEQMMAAPERPTQLDQLEPLVGSWESTGSMKMGEHTMSMTGKNTVGWELDRRILVERMEGHSDEGDFKGLGVWVWDDSAKKFRVFWFDNMGGWAVGTVEHDPGDAEWEFRAKSKWPGGQTTAAIGTMTMDGNTMVWKHAEYTDDLARNKIMAMEGTSRRVK
ncbi:MAG: DUF1579 family protein [Phycisphaerales bacterium]|nr:DUF1579 family protein [Phycisphaerales bacterium]